MIANLSCFERGARLFLALCMGFAAWQIFTHPTARIAVAIFGLYALWEATTGKCPLRASLGGASPHDALPAEKSYLTGLVAIQAVVAYEWLHAGWGKVTAPDFAGNLAKTLAAFAAKNPFTWYKDFLEGFATKNSVALGYAIEYGQLLVGTALLVTAITFVSAKAGGMRRRAMQVAGLAFIGGAIMNASFYLASGWMSPSSSGLNMIMFWIQIILAYVWLSMTVRSK